MMSLTKWRSVRAAIVLLLALSSIGVVATRSWGDPPKKEIQETSKDGGGASTMSASGDIDFIEPAADDPIELFQGVSTVVTPPLGRTCPPTWLFFANPIMHYDMCYPATWGFNDGASTQPMLSVPGPELYGGVQLMSASAFPWTVGDLSLDAALAKDAAVLNFMVHEPHVDLEGCAPSTNITMVGAVGQYCTESARLDNGEVIVDPLGSIKIMKVVAPLATNPTAPSTDVDTTGYELLVYVRTSQTGWTSLQATIFQLINNIRPL